MIRVGYMVSVGVTPIVTIWGPNDYEKIVSFEKCTTLTEGSYPYKFTEGMYMSDAPNVKVFGTNKTVEDLGISETWYCTHWIVKVSETRF